MPDALAHSSSADPLELRAGPLSLIYQAGDLRYVRLGEREIVRRVLVAVRDRNWGTVPNRLSNLQITRGPGWFHIEYDVESRQREIDFAWHAVLTGDAQGALTFAFDGLARTGFWRNRLGLVVLHPIRECAGAPCRVDQADSSVLEAAFPAWIAHDRPLTNIRGLSYPVLPGLWAKLHFEGDLFEMEDQRNWTDASFKTYSTPVSQGFPAEVPAGTRIAQSLALTLLGPIPAITAASDAPPSLVIGSPVIGPLPRLGLGLASHGQPLAPAEAARLRALRLSHLRADLHLDTADWPATLARASRDAQAVGAGLELALHLPAEPAAALRLLHDRMAGLPVAVVTWLLYNTSGLVLTRQQIDLACASLAALAPAAPFFGGTNAYFAELNSHRPPLERLDGLCYSINPQAHAFDTPSLMETFEAQAATVQSARHFAPTMPLAISPLTLRPRFNPVATGPEPEPLPGELPPQVDARQRTLEAAAWTVGSLQALAATHAVASLTLFETTGWRGLMETQAGSASPAAFPSLPGEVFPIYHVLADLAGWREAEVLPVTSTRPLVAGALAWRAGDRRHALIANLTAQHRLVLVMGLGDRARVRLLDERGLRPAALSSDGFRAQPGTPLGESGGELRLELPPYALARLGP